MFRSHRPCEYLFDQFKQLCVEKGIVSHLRIPSTTQENGVAERSNRPLLDMLVDHGAT